MAAEDIALLEDRGEQGSGGYHQGTRVHVRTHNQCTHARKSAKTTNRSAQRFKESIGNKKQRQRQTQQCPLLVIFPSL